MCSLGLQYQVGGAVRQHHGRRVGVGRGEIGEDGRIYDAKAVDAMHPQLWINDRLMRVRPHAAGADRVVDGAAALAEILEDGGVIHLPEIGADGAIRQALQRGGRHVALAKAAACDHLRAVFLGGE